MNLFLASSIFRVFQISSCFLFNLFRFPTQPLPVLPHCRPLQETIWDTQQYKLHEAVHDTLCVCASSMQRLRTVTVVTSLGVRKYGKKSLVEFLDITLTNGLRVSQKARRRCPRFWSGWNSWKKARWSNRISRSLAQKICWEWSVCKEGKLERHLFLSVCTAFLYFCAISLVKNEDNISY